MTDVSYQAAFAVYKKRNKPKFSVESFCFKEQVDFIRDESQFKTAVCSRRSGKTIACAVDLINTAITHANVVCLYITLKRTNAKRIIWPELIKINREYNLGGSPNESDLSIKFKNGSVIYVSGAKDKSEIENFRGLALKKVYIDECQSFRPHIEELIDDVISKALFDYSGNLNLIGTPGMVPAGYFYRCATSNKWAHYAWTMFDNPHIELKSGKKVLQLVQDDCDRMGVTIAHPKIQRECYGKWVTDLESLVFKYDASINHYDQVNFMVDHEFVIGIDVGFEDADAIAVIGWHKHSKTAYLVREDVCRKQGITELSNKIESLIKEFNPLKVVMDTGGLGLKIAEEMRRRYTLPIVAAEKSRKFENVELLNDAMRTKRFMAKRDSLFAQDSMLVEWDYDKSTPDKLKVASGFHSDICFVAGTLIQTNRGEIPIEHICLSDLILTRDGWKTIEACGTTGTFDVIELEFSNGSKLICTPGHPIYTKNRGFIRADALLYDDGFVTLDQCEKPLYLETKSFIDIQNQDTQRTGDTLWGISMAKENTSIEQSGNMQMGRFQMDFRSIIRMATRQITTLKIWRCFQSIAIGKSIESLIKNMAKRTLGFLPKLEFLQKNGISQQREDIGIKNMPRRGLKRIEGLLRPFVLFVHRNILGMQFPYPLFSIVQISVGQNTGVTQGLMTSNSTVSSAIKASKQTSMQKENSALTLVQRHGTIKKEKVYNLTVKDKHEYFANGILVSNCDAVLYGFREATHWLTESAPVKLVPMSPAWLKAHEEEMEQMALKRIQKQDDDVWGDWE